MNPADVEEDMTVRVTSARVILGRSWQGVIGQVWGTFDRGRVEDWVYVQVPDDGLVIVGFAPDEIEPS